MWLCTFVDNVEKLVELRIVSLGSKHPYSLVHLADPWVS